MRVTKTIFSLLAAAMVQAAPAAAQGVLKPVKLMATQASDIRVSRQFYGQVRAKETVDLAFQVPGQILNFPVVEGFIVPKGGLVAQLDLEQFELQLQQAKLQLEQAERTVERLKRLEGTVSKVSIEDAETAAALAAIALRNAEYNLRHATLYAPFDALISSREVAVFSTVNNGTPIVRMHDMSELHIEVDVPEILFQRTEGDEEFDISATFPGQDGVFPLQILEFDAEASSIGQTYRVTLMLPPPDGFEIFPGASATVRVGIRTGESQITLPATALVPNPAGDLGVMVFAPSGADEGTVTWTPVEVAPTQEGTFRVVAGLEGGQELVLTGGSALESGQQVRRFTGFAN
jgi:RND family efflux transporter MFP subunit